MQEEFKGWVRDDLIAEIIALRTKDQEKFNDEVRKAVAVNTAKYQDEFEKSQIKLNKLFAELVEATKDYTKIKLTDLVGLYEKYSPDDSRLRILSLNDYWSVNCLAASIEKYEAKKLIEQELIKSPYRFNWKFWECKV